MCYKCKLHVDISVVSLSGSEWLSYRDHLMDMCFTHASHVLLDLPALAVRPTLCT